MPHDGESHRILLIYGNPKHGGFVHGCVDHIGEHLEAQGVTVDRLHLVDKRIDDCRGCFTCCREGRCCIEDDMEQIIEQMRGAHGFVVGASVRNSFFPALFKRFFERITYILGFGGDLRGKHVLAIGAVGLASGRKPLGKLLTFDGFQACVTGYLFFRTGIPTKLEVADVARKLDQAADRLLQSVVSRRRPPLLSRLQGRINNFVVRKFMLEPNRDNAFDYVIARWRKQGLM